MSKRKRGRKKFPLSKRMAPILRNVLTLVRITRAVADMLTNGWDI